MDMVTKYKRLLWILWVCIVPVGVYFIYQFFPPENIEGELWNIVALFILASIVPLIPITINGTTIFFIQWVTLVGFIKYGLFVEVLLFQISIIPVLIRMKIGKKDGYRLPLSSTMFFLVSLFSGFCFYLVGGIIGYQSISSLIVPVLVYQIASILSNQLLLMLFYKPLNRKFTYLDFSWDFISNLVMLPQSLTLFYLTYELGPVAMVLIGIPFISVSVILRLYNSSEKVNKYLQKAGEFGRQLAESLQVSEVLDLFLQKISQTLPVEYAYILDVKDDELVLLRRIEKGEGKSNDLPSMKRNRGICGIVWSSGKPVMYGSRTEWEGTTEGYMPEGVESILCVPIIRSQKVRGILLLASSKKAAYEKFQLMIVDILCSYFGVAIENAKHHEQTKHNSERCALTKLYNYRYFESLLTLECNHLNVGKRECLSLIMLDIDHFKRINDEYGHQSGNEILVQLASRLTNRICSSGTVARYGGEEFVILLPDVTKNEAFEVAEGIRKTIANTPFIVHSDLDKKRRALEVGITASIGVATAPEDADDTLALIRHADRALYTGAKQAGRNRVAEYVK
jgi:diguanylate cyclase (GGDEF)-like protein